MASLIEIKTPPNGNKMIDGFSCFRFYISMKSHFNCGYDMIKYNWFPKRVSESIYRKRNDKIFFENLAKRFNVGDIYKIFFINFLHNPDAWIGELSMIDSISFYYENYSKFERATYLFKEELENIIFFCKSKGIHFKTIFKVNNGQNILFKMIQQDVISYETFILLNSMKPFIQDLDEQNDIIWIGYSKRIKGYIKLLDINKEKLKKLFIETINQNYRENQK